MAEVKAEVKANVLHLQIPLNPDGNPSQSGKTISHAYYRSDPRAADCPQYQKRPLLVQVTANSKP